jgi:hypothetical protein
MGSASGMLAFSSSRRSAQARGPHAPKLPFRLGSSAGKRGNPRSKSDVVFSEEEEFFAFGGVVTQSSSFGLFVKAGRAPLPLAYQHAGSGSSPRSKSPSPWDYFRSEPADLEWTSTRDLTSVRRLDPQACRCWRADRARALHPPTKGVAER